MKKNIFVFLCLTILHFGCGSASGPVSVRVSLPAAFVAQDSIDRIVMRISGPDLPNYIQQVLRPPFASDVTFDVTVPFGANRTFEVFAPFTGTDNRLLYGRQNFSVLDTDTGVLNLPILPMNFTNFAEDSTGSTDVVDTSISEPDITSFRIYRIDPIVDAYCSGSVTAELHFNSDFVAPASTSLSSLKTLIEFDTDDNPDTGSAVSRIELARGVLSNNFTRGTDLLWVSNNHAPAPPSFAVTDLPVIRYFDTASVYDVSGDTDVPLPSINPSTIFNASTSTLLVCIPSFAFAALDNDGIGRVNVLSGIDSGGDAIVPFSGNDILYRSGYIRYDLNLDATTIPGAAGTGL
ncbi:MAG: hypothetical protein IPJ69_07715 [Deltaproteobacteria bacterium]|nr:MAG: hypothetical protein IPJ69_07715 [Deltaproteobacteria bacterium]